MRKKCDYPEGKGKCSNKAYREVYPIKYHKKPKMVWTYSIVSWEPFKTKKSQKIREDFVFVGGWSFLCRKHFEQEWKRLGKRKMLYATLD